jgi:hypothetical protein
MSSPVLFGISVATSFLAWGAVARYSIWPALKDHPATQALKPILLLHGFRFLGLSFLLPGVASGELPAAFARPAAYGDLTTAFLALLALATLETRTGTALTWAFNAFGTADLLFAFYQGSQVSLAATAGRLGAAYFIVTVLVPLLLITHGLAFRILLGTKVVVPVAEAQLNAASH